MYNNRNNSPVFIKGEGHIWAWIIIMCYKNQLSTPCVYNINDDGPVNSIRCCVQVLFYDLSVFTWGSLAWYMWPLQDGTKTLSMAIFSTISSNHWKLLCELSKSLEVVAISSSMFGSHWKLARVIQMQKSHAFYLHCITMRLLSVSEQPYI